MKSSVGVLGKSKEDLLTNVFIMNSSIGRVSVDLSEFSMNKAPNFVRFEIVSKLPTY